MHFTLHCCFHYNVALLYITKNYSTVQCKGLPLSDTNTNTNRIYKYNILQRSASQCSVKGCLSVIHGPLAESDQADSSGTSSELLFVLGQASEKILKRIEGTIQKYSSCTPKTDVQWWVLKKIFMIKLAALDMCECEGQLKVQRLGWEQPPQLLLSQIFKKFSLTKLDRMEDLWSSVCVS